MSRVKTKNTNHAYLRAAERLGLDKQTATKLMKQASRSGKTPYSLPEGPLRDYLVKKQQGTNKRIRIFQGYVFVFASTSTKCLTVYIPDVNYNNN